MSKKIAYCTIASANYLSRVEVLKTSLQEHKPDAPSYVLLCEHPDVCRSLAAETGYPFIAVDEVCPHWLHMAFYYDIIESNTAFKPFLLQFLLDQGYAAA